MTQIRKALWKRLRIERPCRWCNEDQETGWCPHHLTRNNEGPAIVPGVPPLSSPPSRAMPPAVFLAVLFPNRTEAPRPAKVVHQHARSYDVDDKRV